MNHPIDQIESFITGGLSAEEQTAFKAHIAVCPACAAALNEAQTADAALNDLFAAARPAAGFEDRMIESLRRGQLRLARPMIHPMVRRVAVGLAASLMVGAVGLVGYVAGRAELPDAGLRRGAAESILPSRRGTIMSRQGSDGRVYVPNGKAIPFGDSKEPTLEYRLRGATSYNFFGYSKEPDATAYPRDNLDSYILPTDGPNRLHAGGIGQGGGSGGEPGVAANTGIAVNGSAPSKLPALGVGGYLYWGENEKLGPANAPPLRPPTPPPAPPVVLPIAPVAFEPGPVQAPPPQPQAQPKPVPAPVPAVEVVIKPKIIRTGDMEFEVDSFDSSAITITKIVTEEGGYVSTTNSEKLPNGKVKGSIVLRVAPEHLDTLVLKLRAVGDLRTQHIVAQDITKQYTDLESKLRAAQVMQERLLDMIKNGKGTVKDLLEAEKQLGVVGENVEQLEGEIRYYNHQVSLSTLTLTLFERDIRTPAVASETDAVTMAIETENVIDADAKAKDAIAQGKGRIVNASLTQDASGKLMSTISARFPPDSAEAVIGRLKQIDGRIARFDRQRNQTTSNGSSPVDAGAAEPIKVKREDVTINLTIYNLANLDPRRVTIVTVVVPNVEEADCSLKDLVRLAGGHIIESQNSNAQPDQTAERVKFDVPTDKADALLVSMRGMGEVLAANTTENASAQNVTESKRGLVVSLGTMSSFAARESQQIELASTHVRDAFADLKHTLQTVSARILTDNLNEQDRTNIVGRLEFEITRASLATFEQALDKQGQVVTRVADRAAHGENTVDSKVHITLTIGNSEQLPARQATDLTIEVANAQQSMDDLQAAALSVGGRQVDTPSTTQGDNGQTTAHLALDIPLDQLPSLIVKADAMGARKSRQTSIDAHAPEGKLARARLSIIFTMPTAPAVSNDGIWAGATRVLRPGFHWLGIGSILLGVGLFVVAAWAVVMWSGWRVVKWLRGDACKSAATVDPSGQSS